MIDLGFISFLRMFTPLKISRHCLLYLDKDLCYVLALLVFYRAAPTNVPNTDNPFLKSSPPPKKKTALTAKNFAKEK